MPDRVLFRFPATMADQDALCSLSLLIGSFCSTRTHQDHTGYEFWLNKLNQFGGNFVNAEMVKAFIVSIEYRNRFGQ
jgi:hypothetical protein